MTAELSKALASAQSEMRNAVLNKINPHFKSKYADLATIRDATIPVLAKRGLAIAQYTRVIETGALVLVTRLMHESGEYIEGEYPLPAAIEQPQKMGSALTYARRYCWSAMCGIAADEDDDGGAASKEPTAAPLRYITENQHKAIEAAVREHGLDRDRVKSWVNRRWGAAHLNQITDEQFHELMDRMPGWAQPKMQESLL